MIIRIATRRSPLAMWQAHHVSALLRTANPRVETEFVSKQTSADLDLTLPIAELGGKGAFSKEVQELVLADHADLAVHSAKDLQAVTPEGLTIGAYPERGDVRDVLVGCAMNDLAAGAVIATGSARRRVQLAHLRPDLSFVGLRGNIETRLSKLGEFDALVMANAALSRLGLFLPVADVIDPSVMVPQVGQGALAVECRAGDKPVEALLAAIDHRQTRTTVEAERGFLTELGGDCTQPAGAHAELIEDGRLRLRAVLASDDEARLERATVVSNKPVLGETAAIGAEAARQLQERLGS